jgi:hypothetical protein
MGLNLTKTNLAEKADVGYEFELLLPDGLKHTGAFLTVRGGFSSKVKQFTRRKVSEMQLQEQAAKKKGREAPLTTYDDAEDFGIETCLVRLMGWRGVLEEDEKGVAKEVPFDEENVRRILKEHSWMRDAIVFESDSLSNFI